MHFITALISALITGFINTGQTTPSTGNLATPEAKVPYPPPTDSLKEAIAQKPAMSFSQ